MVSKYLNFLPEYVLPKIAISPFFKRVTRFMNLHFSPRKDIMVNVGGKKMYASTLDRLFVLYLWKFSIMENFETKLIKEIVKMGMTVFDIGANIGYYTLVLAEKVGKTGKVYAQTDMSDGCEYIDVRTHEALGFKNVKHLSAGISGWLKAGKKLAKKLGKKLTKKPGKELDKKPGKKRAYMCACASRACAARARQ